MIKSYSNQKNRRQRPENLVIRVKAVLPDNISSNVKNQLTEVLASTKFSKLPINIFVPSSFIYAEDRSNDERKPFRINNFVSAGFIRNYFIEDKSFEVVVFSKYADKISEFTTPAIEIIYRESNDSTELNNIIRFNIIDIDKIQQETELHRDHRFTRRDRRNTSYKTPVQNSVSLNPMSNETGKESALESARSAAEDKDTVDDSMGVTIGDVFNHSVAESNDMSEEEYEEGPQEDSEPAEELPE